MTTTIPAGWLPIESAPKDGTPVLLFARLAGVNFATNSPYAPTIHVGAYRADLCIWTGSAYRDQREIEIEPTHWMPRPAFPDCAAPGVSRVEESPAAGDALTAAAPEWINCESRRPWVANGLRAAAHALRDKEKGSRTAFNKDFMGLPSRYMADAYAEAAAVFERRLGELAAQRKGDA